MEALYFEEIDTPFEPVYIHIPGHQPIEKKLSKDEAKAHYAGIEKAKLMRLVWANEALEISKKQFKKIEIL